MKERVQVLCRVKPARGANGLSVTETDTVAVASETDRSGPRSWTFDGVFDKDAKQAAVYEEAGQPILDAVLQGYNGTILAYGQTGSGKTHTLLHKGASPDEAGLVPRLVAALFVAIGCDVRHVYRVKASFAQIYNEQIDDLLKPRNTNLRVRASAGGGAAVDGLSCTVCKSAEQLLSLFEAGRRHLVYAETKMNKSSSRSHAVLQIKVARRLRVLDAGGAGSYTTTMQTGKLTLVDLAGSERVKRSGAGENEARFREAVNINTSLLGLSNVMKALSQNASFVPYRDSRLTHMLSDALGGNCRTTLIVCASPTAADAAESVGTLEFGARAMKVRTNAQVNSETVELDAAALAADLSDALRLRAEGGLPGQLMELEAALAERESVTAALRRQASEESKVQRAELEAAREAAEAEGARHMAALERMQADLHEAASARARAEAAARREVGEREEMEGRLATRSLELHAQVEDTRQHALETQRVADELRAERRSLLGALRDADGELGAAAAACALSRAELADANADAHSLRSRLELASRAAADAAEAREIERSDAAAEARALADAHALALAEVHEAAAPLGALVEKMQGEMAAQAQAHADAHAATVARLDGLQAQYEELLAARDVGARELAEARAACDEFKARLADEQRRRDAEAKALADELSGRSSELRKALGECEAKSRMLSAAHGAHELQAEQLGALAERAREAEEGLASAEARLAQVEADLSGTRAERRSLVVEQASLAAMAASEMAAADEARYAEVQALLAACASREASLVAERSALEAANAARAVALREAEAEAMAERAEARARSDELLGRLQRQAVHGAAAVRELHYARGDLGALGAERSELKAEGDALADRLADRDDALQRAGAELSGAHAKFRAAELAHARQTLRTGVVATKHGRRGKPHARLVRCSDDLSRLEWVLPGAGTAEPEKALALDEISGVVPGLQSAVARRSAAGKEPLVLCVLSKRRSLDLEFPTQAARDQWLATWRFWLDGARSDAPAAKCITVGVERADSGRVATGG